MVVQRIISGGQTGVDRAALDVAMDLGLRCGGWCPAGRAAEDGPIPADYPLVETASDDPAERTDLNVRDSDGTLIITTGKLAGGTALTEHCAIGRGKPFLVTDPADREAASGVREWLEANGIEVLNVAGPRESEAPGIYGLALALLTNALGPSLPTRP